MESPAVGARWQYDLPLRQLHVPAHQASLVTSNSEKGLKPTATGNLPRNVCREVASAYWGDGRFILSRECRTLLADHGL
jgi:hypothetical protein